MGSERLAALLIAAAFLMTGIGTDIAGAPTRQKEELPWTVSVLSIGSEPSYYIGETLQVVFNLTSGCQGLSFNVSDASKNLAEGYYEIGHRPYENDTNTRGLWELDRIVEGKVNDTSRYGNTGGVHKVLCAPSAFHEGLDLSGTGSYVDVTSSMSLNISEPAISIEMWVNLSGTTTAKRMVVISIVPVTATP